MKNTVQKYFNEKSKIYSDIDFDSIEKLALAIINTYENDGYFFIVGNGGGSAIAEGIAIDLKTHPFVKEDKSVTTEIRRMKVICLNESTGVITGISNDISNDKIYSEQLKNYLRTNEKYEDSLFLALSGSGNSKNILECINYAKKLKVKTSCISGRGGGQASKLVDIPIVIPGTSTFPGQTGKNDNNFHIEDIQNSIGHILVGLLKRHVEINLA
jgi:D-sedoheptulose 7-phosphate isomerase